MDSVRRLIAFALLLVLSASAGAATQGEAWEGCLANAQMHNEAPGGSKPFYCEAASICGASDCSATPDQCGCVVTYDSFSPRGSYGFWAWNGATVCTAGSNQTQGSFSGDGDENGDHCDIGSFCKYQETSGVEVCMNGKCVGNYAQTGEVCDEPDGPGAEEGPPCIDVGGGYQQCSENGKVCVKTPKGSSFCWTPNESQQQTNSEGDEGADKSPGNDPPPTEPDHTPFVETSRQDSFVNGQPTTFTTYENDSAEGDEDGDGTGDDSDGDDDNDQVPDEEDDEEAERTATLTGCSAQPSCDGDPIDCAHYITSWRHYCAGQGDTVSGGAECSSAPVCDTDNNPIQCAQLVQLWRLRCDSDARVSGETTCSAPPLCTGDVLGCAAVRQQWQIQCALTGSVGGAESCGSPPTCTGSPVLCATYKEQWRERCAREGRSAEPASCTAPPDCSGDEIDCAAMQWQWMAACESERGADGIADLQSAALEGNDLLAQIRDNTDGATVSGGETCANPPSCSGDDGQCALILQTWRARCDAGAEEEGPPEGDPNTIFETEGGALESVLDATGFLTDRSCPVFPVVEVYATPLDFNANGAWCDVLGLLRALVMAGAYFIAARVLMGAK